MRVCIDNNFQNLLGTLKPMNWKSMFVISVFSHVSMSKLAAIRLLT